MQSMTGYGHSIYEDKKYKVEIELESLNSRFKEIAVKLPECSYFLDTNIRKIVNKHINRGKVNVLIKANFFDNTPENFLKQKNLSEKVQEIEKNIKKQIKNFQGFKTIEELLSIRPYNRVSMDFIRNIGWKIIKKTLIEALEKLNKDRAREGKFLKKEILNSIKHLENSLNKIIKITPKILNNNIKNLKERINNILKKYKIPENNDRIYTEIAFLSQKIDINEEIIRLKAHIEELKKTVNSKEQIGRKMDFILQEIFRELNTIGNKSTDKFLSELVVDMKVDIEKIKEQNQNIE